MRHDDWISLRKRRQAFRDLVDLQDDGVRAGEAERRICEKYRVGIHRMQQIITEGIDADWLETYDEEKELALTPDEPVIIGYPTLVDGEIKREEP